MFFLTQVFNFCFVPINSPSLFFSHIFCEIKYPVIHISFHNWEIATRKDDFRAKWNLIAPQTLLCGTSRKLNFSEYSVCSLNISESHSTSTVDTLQKTNIKPMNYLTVLQKIKQNEQP